MTPKLWTVLTLLCGSLTISACAPAVVGAVAVGAGGAIMADKAAEQDGDEGLF